MDKDYYKIIGLTKTASVEEIKKAYRALAMNVSKTCDKAASQFQP